MAILGSWLARVVEADLLVWQRQFGSSFPSAANFDSASEPRGTALAIALIAVIRLPSIYHALT